MEINKQLFEDVLSNKLKGKFVLRNGDTYSSVYLYRNYNKFRFTHPYMIGFGSYTPKGLFPIYGGSKLDIVDFIPDTDMKENELTIEIPKGYEIDKENSTFEKIVFKKKDSKPRSWEEFCENYHGDSYYITSNSNISGLGFNPGKNPLDVDSCKNTLPTKELAEAFLAMMQLMSLRQAWIGDWDSTKLGNAIKLDVQRNIIVTNDIYYGPLTFPNRKMALDFMTTFKDLLEIAKPLI